MFVQCPRRLTHRCIGTAVNRETTVAARDKATRGDGSDGWILLWVGCELISADDDGSRSPPRAQAAQPLGRALGWS